MGVTDKPGNAFMVPYQLHRNSFPAIYTQATNSIYVTAIFKQSTELCYTSVGYKLARPKFAKIYSEADIESGTTIRSFRSGLSINILGNPDDIIQTVSCSY